MSKRRKEELNTDPPEFDLSAIEGNAPTEENDSFEFDLSVLDQKKNNTPKAILEDQSSESVPPSESSDIEPKSVDIPSMSEMLADGPEIGDDDANEVAPTSDKAVEENFNILDFVSVDGTENPIEYGENARKDSRGLHSEGDKFDYNREASQRNDLSKARRERENILKYGESAQIQLRENKRKFRDEFGKDIEKTLQDDIEKLESIKTEYNSAESGAMKSKLAQDFKAIQDKIAPIVNSETYQEILKSEDAIKNAYDTYESHSESSVLKGFEVVEKTLQDQADERSKDPDVLSTKEELQKAGTRAGMKGITGLLSLPRTIKNAVGANDFGVLDELGFFADDLKERVEVGNKKASNLQRKTFENIARYKDMQVEFKDDEIVAVRDSEGYFITPNEELVKEIKESGVSKNAEDTFTGMAPLASSSLDATADLAVLVALTRGFGGAQSLGGRIAVSENLATIGGVTMQMQQEAFTKAIEKGMSPDEAGQYALALGAGIGAVSLINPMERAAAFGPMKASILSTIEKEAAKGVTGKALAKKSIELLKGVGTEALEEGVLEQIYEKNILNASFNSATGSELDAKFDYAEAREGAIIGAVVSFGPTMASISVDSRPEFYKRALLSAAKNPSKHRELVESYVKNGVLTEDEGQKEIERIEKLSNQLETIPEGTSEKDAESIVSLQEARNEKEDSLNDGKEKIPVVEKKIKDEITEIDNQIEEILFPDENKENESESTEGQKIEPEKEQEQSKEEVEKPTSAEKPQVEKEKSKLVYKSGTYDVKTNPDGSISVINTKTKNEASDKVRKRILNEYKDNQIDKTATQGKRLDFEGVPEQDVTDYVIDNATSPVDVAQAWNAEEKYNKDGLVTKDEIIADGLGKVTEGAVAKFFNSNESDYKDHKRTYINENGETDLSDLAERMSRESGQTITDQDIADHILANPQRVKASKAILNPKKKALEEKFEKLTGFKLDQDYADRLVKRPGEIEKENKLKSPAKKKTEESQKERDEVRYRIPNLVKRFLADPTVPKEYKTRLKKEGKLFREVMTHESGRKIADEFVNEVIEQYGDTRGLHQLVDEVEKEWGSADNVMATVFSFTLQKIQRIAMKSKDMDLLMRTLELEKRIQGAGGAFNAAKRESASPDNYASLLTSKVLNEQSAAMQKNYKGKTYGEIISDLHKEIIELKKKNAAKARKSGKTEKTAKKDDIKKRRSDAIDRLKNITGKVGFAADPVKEQEEMLKAIRDIAASFIEEGVLEFKDLLQKVKEVLKSAGVEDNRADELTSQVLTETGWVSQNEISQLVKDRLRGLPTIDKNLKQITKGLHKSLGKGWISEQELKNYLGKYLGYPEVNLDRFNNIQELYDKLYKAKTEREKNKLYGQIKYEMNLLENNGYTFAMAANMVMELYYVGILSGISTTKRALFGALTTTGMETVTNLLSNPTATIKGVKYFFGETGIKSGLGEARGIYKTGISNLDYLDRNPSADRVLDRVINKSFKEYLTGDKNGKEALKLALKAVYHIPMQMYRTLMAMDAVIKHGLIEWNSYINVYNQLLSEGISRSDSKFNSELNERLGYANLENMRNKIDQEIAEMKANGEKIPAFYKNERLKEQVLKLRTTEVQLQANQDALVTLLMNQPEGVLGTAANFASTASNVNERQENEDFVPYAMKSFGKLLFRSIFPFLRVPTNFVNMGLSYTPVGLYKSGVLFAKGMKQNENSHITMRHARQHMARFVIGTLSFAFMRMSLFDDDEDKGLKVKSDSFRITGGAGDDWEQAKQFDEAWKPNVLQEKKDPKKPWTKDNLKSETSYVDNPLGFALAPFGILSDRLAKGEDVSEDGVYSMYVLNSIKFGTEQSYTQGLKEIMKMAKVVGPAFSGDAEARAKGEDKFYKELNKSLSKRVSAFSPNIYKQATQHYNALHNVPQKKAEGIQENFIKNLPVLDNLIQEEKTDMLGFPDVRDFDIPFIPGFMEDAMDKYVGAREETHPEWKILYKYPQVSVNSYWPPRKISRGKSKGSEISEEIKKGMTKIYKDELRSSITSKLKKLDKLDAKELQDKLDEFMKKARSEAMKYAIKTQKR